MRILDYSGGPPSAKAIKAADFGGAVRYLPKIGGSGVVVLTTAEWLDFEANGLELAVIYEARSGGRALTGSASGVQDAAWALQWTKAITGITVPRCIYFAVDVDVTTQQALVDAYLDGAASVIGRGAVGVYGEFSVVEHCLSTGKAHWGWQTKAWSGTSISGRACLYQDTTTTIVDGVSCDVNVVRLPDWGQLSGGDMPLTAADVTAVVAGVKKMLVAGGALGDLNTIRDWMGPNIVTPLAEVKTSTDATAAALTGLVPAIIAAVKADPPPGWVPTDAQLTALGTKISSLLLSPSYTGTVTMKPTTAP